MVANGMPLAQAPQSNDYSNNTNPIDYLVVFDINSQTLISQLLCLRFKQNNPNNRSDSTDGFSSKSMGGGSTQDEWICIEMRPDDIVLSPPESQSLSGFVAKSVLKKDIFHSYYHPKETTYLIQVKMSMLLDCIYLCASSSKNNESMINMKYPGRENSLVISSGRGGRNSVCSIRTKSVDSLLPRSDFGGSSSNVARFEIDAQVLREALREILYWQHGVVIEIDPDKFTLRTKNNDVTAVQVSIESRTKAFQQYRCQGEGTKDEYTWDHLFKCLQPLSNKAITTVHVTTNDKNMIRFRYFPTTERNSNVEYVVYPVNHGSDTISDDEVENDMMD